MFNSEVNMDLKKEKSCGCIIIKNNKALLIYEKIGKFWGFPKGHMEEGESEIQTALREVKEEVGLDVKIDESKKYVINYTINNEIEKTTILYIATPLNENIEIQESEIENIKWCDFDEVLDVLTYDNWKEMFKKVIQDIDKK